MKTRKTGTIANPGADGTQNPQPTTLQSRLLVWCKVLLLISSSDIGVGVILQSKEGFNSPYSVQGVVTLYKMPVFLEYRAYFGRCFIVCNYERLFIGVCMVVVF